MLEEGKHSAVKGFAIRQTWMWVLISACGNDSPPRPGVILLLVVALATSPRIWNQGWSWVTNWIWWTWQHMNSEARLQNALRLLPWPLWPLSLGKPSYHCVRTPESLCRGTNMENWSVLPKTSTNQVNLLEVGLLAPTDIWLQHHERPWVWTTQLSCFWIPDSLKSWEIINGSCCFKS